VYIVSSAQMAKLTKEDEKRLDDSADQIGLSDTRRLASAFIDGQDCRFRPPETGGDSQNG
jgi:hypothetical protein